MRSSLQDVPVVSPRDATSAIARLRRSLQVAFGLVWLLDAALQYQPFMFGRAFAMRVIEPTAQGNPRLVAQPVVWAAHAVVAHPVLWNALFATVQLALALGLFWRRTVKLALAGSVAWSLLVWWLGEGLGGVLTGSASPQMGAPGAVILYALVAMLLWPAGDERASVASSSLFRRGAPAAWVVLWASEAYFALLPANDSGSALHDQLAGMADGEPGWLASLDRGAATLAGHHGATVGLTFGILLALAALAVALPAPLARPLLALAALLGAAIWIVGQDLGGILTGQGTDPNSGPLLILLALAYWPLRSATDARSLAKATGARIGGRLATAGAAAAAAALVGGAALAAATTTPAAQSGARPATTAAKVGPGPVSADLRNGPYEVQFRNLPNRASSVGTIAVRLERHGHPVTDARIRVTLTSLTMHMASLGGLARPTAPGRYARRLPILGMSGRWRIRLEIQPHRGRAFAFRLTDEVA